MPQLEDLGDVTIVTNVTKLKYDIYRQIYELIESSVGSIFDDFAKYAIYPQIYGLIEVSGAVGCHTICAAI